MKLLEDPVTGARCLVADEELDLYADWAELPEEEALALELRIAKDACRSVVNRERDQRQSGTAATPIGGKRADANDTSKVKINGLVSMAMLAKTNNTPFAVNFTFADNDQVLLNADQMVAVGVAVGSHVINCHEHATTLKAAIEATETMADLEAIDVMAGWP